MLNQLNRLLLLEHGALAGGAGARPQVSSAELTFRLRSRPDPYLLMHCDHEEYDRTTAVFIVSLSHGSQPTVLSGRPNTTASNARCRAASEDVNNAACASDRAGAATFLPLHACHSRPVGDAPRDVVAVHVRWTAEPPTAVALAHMLHSLSLSRRCEAGEVASYCSAPPQPPLVQGDADRSPAIERAGTCVRGRGKASCIP